MNWFKTIKEFYDTDRYTKEKLGVFVMKEKITTVQYQEITGVVYPS
jgi:uncharacterized XkdX family phage protein